MVASVDTVAFQGIDVRPIEVQVQIANGMPAFNIVGLPDKAVAESKERVRSALHSLGLSLPPKRLTVNLAPADVSKEGSHYDLPIALGLLAAMGVIAKDELRGSVVLGELALDAWIRSVTGVLPAAIHAVSNDNRLICPKSCGGEAAWAGDLDILAPNDLLQLINHIKGTQVLLQPEAKLSNHQNWGTPAHIPCLSDVKGQESAKRALEVSTIHSLAGTLPDGGLLKYRPFRDPHHSASLPALIDGGHKIKPGEISLAHNGVLFLDELPAHIWQKR